MSLAAGSNMGAVPKAARCAAIGCTAQVPTSRRRFCDEHIALPKWKRHQLAGERRSTLHGAMRIDRRELGNPLAAQPAIVSDEYVDTLTGPCEIHEGHEHPCAPCARAITEILADVRDDVRARERSLLTLDERADRSAFGAEGKTVWRFGYVRGPQR